MQYFAFMELVTLLACPSTPLFTHKGERYVLRSIEREDGSGRSFNVHVLDMNGSPQTLYIRITG